MTPDRLRELYGAPGQKAANKVISRFDDHCRAFIKHSPFVILASANGTKLDVSPKGDHAGFIEVESDTRLLVPDRPGNNRLDGLMNILANPSVALLFLIPTVAETLRVNGIAEISDDPKLCERFAVKGRLPKTVLRIESREILMHCGKAPIRGGLWNPKTWPQSRPVATLFEMIRDHSQIPMDAIGQDAVDKSYERSLY